MSTAWRLFRLVPLMLLPVASATASLITIESFAYTNGSSLTGDSGGFGWGGAWNLQDPAHLVAFVINPTGFALGNAPGGIGGASGEIRALAADENSGTVWMSVVLALGSSPGGGIPEFRLYENGAPAGGIGSNTGMGSSYYLLDSTLTNSNWNTNIALSQTARHLFVLEIDYTTSATYLWVDPDRAAFTGDTSITTVTATSFAPAFNQIAMFGRTGDRFGQIRIGTTYADVIVPEPAAWALIAFGLAAVLARRHAQRV